MTWLSIWFDLTTAILIERPGVITLGRLIFQNATLSPMNNPFILPQPVRSEHE